MGAINSFSQAKYIGYEEEAREKESERRDGERKLEEQVTVSTEQVTEEKKLNEKINARNNFTRCVKIIGSESQLIQFGRRNVYY